MRYSGCLFFGQSAEEQGVRTLNQQLAQIGFVLAVRWFRLGFAILGLTAVIVQLMKSTNVANFFSFFTIQSNIIGIVMLFIGAIWAPRETRNWSLARGGAAIYLMLTGVIYNTLLVDITESLQTTIPWVNDVLHKILPIVMLVDLVVVPMANRIRWREATVWVVYPILYLVYSLIRGAIVDWYPYPFLDPRGDGSYLKVALFSMLTLVIFLGVIWIITEFNAWRLRMRTGTA